MIGWPGLLLDSDLTPQQREYGAAVRQSGEALLAVVDDVLDFSKIEAGRLDIEAVDFAVRDVIEAVAGALGGRRARRGWTSSP